MSHTVSADGRKQFAIRCDAIRIRKAKLGALRFGLLKEAVIENASIEIFQHTTGSPAATQSRASVAGKVAAPLGATQEARLDHIFSHQNLEAIGIKGVRALSFVPVEIRLLGHGLPLWQITADKATLEPRPLRLAFRGHVILDGPTGIVRTPQLTWNLENGSLNWPAKAPESSPMP